MRDDRFQHPDYFQVDELLSEEQKLIRDAVRRSLRFELSVTDEVNNPFGYARQLVRMGDGTVRTAFFFPHDTEAAPWWQGEDATPLLNRQTNTVETRESLNG